jgi:hypothetical protein
MSPEIKFEFRTCFTLRAYAHIQVSEILYQTLLRTVESRIPEPPEAKLAPLMEAATPMVFFVVLLIASPPPLLLATMRARYEGGLLLKPRSAATNPIVDQTDSQYILMALY